MPRARILCRPVSPAGCRPRVVYMRITVPGAESAARITPCHSTLTPRRPCVRACVRRRAHVLAVGHQGHSRAIDAVVGHDDKPMKARARRPARPCIASRSGCLCQMPGLFCCVVVWFWLFFFCAGFGGSAHISPTPKQRTRQTNIAGRPVPQTAHARSLTYVPAAACHLAPQADPKDRHVGSTCDYLICNTQTSVLICKTEGRHELA